MRAIGSSLYCDPIDFCFLTIFIRTEKITHVVRNVYQMALFKYPEMLYNNLTVEMDVHFKEVANHVAGMNDEIFLSGFCEAWKQNRDSILKIREAFMYLNRVYLYNNSKLSTYELGMKLFTDNVMRDTRIKDRLNIILEAINSEHECEMINNKNLIKDITQMLVELDSVGLTLETCFMKPSM